jgi:heme-degrading monooxygenase HmoA
MLVTVFRSRLRPGVRDEYVALVGRMIELAQTMPGYVSHKDFSAEDGERVTIVEFEHEEGLRAWRTNPEHLAAQKLARQEVLQHLPHSGLHARPRVEVHRGRHRQADDFGTGLTRARRRAI